ncbi:MAG: hypothetical protein A3H98_03415 [Bacteroidetes bacterium RIFCSPLOWO2_02_FULL_36_8]|nr:MAG: hypothetical protein A3H98_03415 [Bacteroidetes bacterium RIFCSPLOWO2_02_FULL_36_8]OFY69491.1 MAG: hypothetical protein A3G23_10660 [Bacteroidetes bacterium RIFCSPLOWO2_12_FULL_37_12]
MKTLYTITRIEKAVRKQLADRLGNFYLIAWLITLVTVFVMSCSSSHDKLIDQRFKKHASNKSFKAYYSIQMR